MYECHSLVDSGYYLKSRSLLVRLVSCLPKSNKGMRDDYLIAFGEWHDGLHCPTREGEPVRVPRVRSLDMGFNSLVLLLFPLVFHFFLMMGFTGLTVIFPLGCFYR